MLECYVLATSKVISGREKREENRAQRRVGGAEERRGEEGSRVESKGEEKGEGRRGIERREEKR